jgi:two-component system chemotaxis response regulator CheY
MKKCLVVDDSTTIRKAILMILRSFEFDFQEAENGKIALDVCYDAMPDVIILDWNMPVMTGIEFLEEMRRLPDGDIPKVIFCTTNTEMEHVQEALQKGADEYIMKPFTREIIQDKLEILGIL